MQLEPIDDDDEPMEPVQVHDDMIASGSFEACPAYRGAHHDAVCDGCGWLAADHERTQLAEVIPVPLRRPQPLRKAS